MSNTRFPQYRIGIDLGGTKIEGLLLAPDGSERARARVAAPRDDYTASVGAVRDLVLRLEQLGGVTASVGIGMPGSLSPATGRVQNANSTWLNGRPFDRDLSAALNRPVRLGNDANCFALSEAVDGACAGYAMVFGVILGTGCGGGIVRHGQIIDGPRGTGGEWGHNALPWPDTDDHPTPRCWCGREGCMEAWVSGPALSADHARRTGVTTTAEDIVSRVEAGDTEAAATLARHARRLARGLAAVTNILDPDCIVLGGGLSKMRNLYEQLPALMTPYLFSDNREIIIRPPKWGDASGARGAAWLWPREDTS